jgi:hypothetical protein
VDQRLSGTARIFDARHSVGESECQLAADLVGYQRRQPTVGPPFRPRTPVPGLVQEFES